MTIFLGVTVKVFVVDIQKEIILPPISVRAYLVQTVEEFKALLSQVTDVFLIFINIFDLDFSFHFFFIVGVFILQ